MADRAQRAGSSVVFLCRAEELEDSGRAVVFDLICGSQPEAAFAVRYGGRVYAYINRCTHVPMTLDFQPGRFFDASGHWLICATHGALYSPQTGQCRMGPCRGGLLRIEVEETDGAVYWHTSDQFQPLPQAK